MTAETAETVSGRRRMETVMTMTCDNNGVSRVLAVRVSIRGQHREENAGL